MAEKGESGKYTTERVDISDGSSSDNSSSGTASIGSSSSEDLDPEVGMNFYVSDFVVKYLEEKRQQQKIIFQTSSSMKEPLKALLTNSLLHKRSLPPSSEVPSKVTLLCPSPPSNYPSNPSQTSTTSSSEITSELVTALLSNVSAPILTSKSPPPASSSPSTLSDQKKPRSSLKCNFPRVPTFPRPDSNAQAQSSSPQKTKRLVPKKATPSTSRYQQPLAQQMITQTPSEMHAFLFELSSEYKVSLGTVYEAVRAEKLYYRGRLTGLYSEKSVKVVVGKHTLEKVVEKPVKEVEVQATPQPVKKEVNPIQEYTDTSRKGGPYKNKRTS